MKILVTGASGFLGEHLAEYLSTKQGLDVFTLDRAPLSSRSMNRKRNWTLPILNTNSSTEEIYLALSKHLHAHRFEGIIHCAANSRLNECENNPMAAYHANVQYSQAIIQYAGESNTYLCGISTDLVFDGNTIPPTGGFTEEQKPNPISVYAKTKFKMEKDIAHLEKFGMILRTSLLYGFPKGRNGGPLQWILTSLRDNRTIPAFFDEWRTPLYVSDMVEIIWKCLTEKHSGILHCSGSSRYSREEFTREVIKAAGGDQCLLSACSRKNLPSPPCRPEDVSLSNRKLVHSLNFTPSDLQDGLRKTFLKHEVASGC